MRRWREVGQQLAQEGGEGKDPASAALIPPLSPCSAAPQAAPPPEPLPRPGDGGLQARPAAGEGAAWSRSPRGEGRQFLSAELKGFKGRLLKGPQKGPGPEEAPPPPSAFRGSHSGPLDGGENAEEETVVRAAQGTEPPLVGLGPR